MIITEGAWVPTQVAALVEVLNMLERSFHTILVCQNLILVTGGQASSLGNQTSQL
ncbi:UNVERIFIED_CONTAM: hypothetical protein FKN15_074001 [Acipenser sinensis]